MNHLSELSQIVPSELRAFCAAHPKLALAFSGGSDSAYLLCAAKLCGAEVGAYYVKSPFQPAFETADALRLAREVGCELHTLALDTLSDAAIAANPKDRCYHCKKRIFGAILAAARQDGYTLLIDGTNASDLSADRPGMRALTELGVQSPLRACGITKADLRAYSKRAGIFTWNKPAYACLATRIPQGMPITGAMLDKIERSESALAQMGFSDFRVRVLGDLSAKLQVTADQLPRAVELHREICAALARDFPYVLLDLCPRGESL